MKFKDYYKILGVSDSANSDEIKRAYRKKARLYHPDVSKESDAEEKFKSVNEAYEVLKDKNRRAEFDQLKKHGFRGGDDFRRPQGWQGDWNFNPGAGSSRAGGGSADFSDFFESIFGGGGFDGSGGFAGAGRAGGHGGAQYRTAGRHSKGDDIRLTVRVSLENAYRGGKTKIKVPASVGYEDKILNVSIPAGVVDGQQLRLRGQGRPGASNGDLVLTIKLKPHDLFSVDGANITLNLPITPSEAVQGAQVQVPTLSGKVNLKIPPNTASGARFKIKARGLPAAPNGDQIVVVQIALPSTLTDSDKAALKSMESGWDYNPRVHFDTADNSK